MGKLFTERYKNIINDEFLLELELNTKNSIVSTIYDFDEPQNIYRGNRYQNYEERTSALSEVMKDFSEYKKMDADTLGSEWLMQCDLNELFDIMEMQFMQLSSSEATAFQDDVNGVFNAGNSPWRMLDGKIIKIDSLQFEQDIINQAIIEMCCDTPLFQTAYEELIKSIVNYENNNYEDSILYAEKSYESVLKIITNLTRGTAESLTKAFVNSEFMTNLPNLLSREGFQKNILMSLPYIRNQLLTGHGKGATYVDIPKPLSKLAINFAASLNTYLIQQYSAYISKATNIQCDDSNDDDLPF